MSSICALVVPSRRRVTVPNIWFLLFSGVCVLEGVAIGSRRRRRVGLAALTVTLLVAVLLLVVLPPRHAPGEEDVSYKGEVVIWLTVGFVIGGLAATVTWATRRVRLRHCRSRPKCTVSKDT
jgi:peptidoglycan/LPS O-acetylase OafA/YrhL